MKKQVVAVFVVATLTAVMIASILQQRRINRQVTAERHTRGVLSEVLDEALSFWDEHGRYPNNLDELLASPATGSVKDNEINRSASRGIDGWGHPVTLRVHVVKGQDILEIRSSGTNTLFGDEDDVVKWFPIEP